MRVVVFGATGFTGGAIACELLARGHEVIGVARNSDALANDTQVTAVSGSIHDLAFLERVAAGADALVVAVQGGATETSPALAESIAGIAEVTGKLGVRLGVVGGAGSLFVAEGGPRLFDTPQFPPAFAPGSKSMYQVLVALRESATEGDWFYLSPAAGYGKHNPGERTGNYRVGGDVLVTDPAGNSNISRDDYAIAFVDELENPKHHKVRFTVAY